jgi:anti-anti-sigma factor
MASSQHLIIQAYQGIVLAKITTQRLLDPPMVNGIHADLLAQLDRHPRISLVIDLSEVRYLASAMIGKLVSVQKRITQLKGRLVVTGIRPEIKPILAAIQFEKLVEVHADAESAILKFRRTPMRG